MDTPPTYSRISTHDVEDSHVVSDASDHEPHNPLRHASIPNAPSIAISPPPTAPPRAGTEDSYISAISRPLSHFNTEPLEDAPHDTSEKRPRDRRHSSLNAWKGRMQTSFTPSQHDLSEKPISELDTKRQYSRKKQRHRLWRLTIGEFINTVVICVIYFGILYGFSKRSTINVPQRRIFNAMTTAVSLVLGVNLAASLRSYAKLLRWRMLAICHRPLETFDLVMGCDSLMNVIKLMFKARDHKHKFLPSRTQMLCFLWLLVHLAVTVLVGIIGLNYNLNDSTQSLLTRSGNISIVDLNALSSGFYSYDLAQVQVWGIRGLVTTPLDSTDDLEMQQSYFSDNAGWSEYYFQDQSSSDSQDLIISSRCIVSQAYCTAYEVEEGAYGNLSYVTYNDGSKLVNQTLPADVGSGGLMTMSKLNSTCGSRCVDMQAFQAAGDDGLGDSIPQGTYFICNNTVPQVADDRNPDLTSAYLVSDLVGRMLAGALGWSDTPPAFDGKAEYAVYTNSSRVSFGGQPLDTDMANLISSFTMGAVAFMDNSFSADRKNVTSDNQPYFPQVLEVKWKFAGAILGVIPFIHLLTLTAVILWANKAIIKDDSHLAIAKVYQTLLQQLGDRGCLLRGDEIVEALGDPNVAYGWRASSDANGSSLMHVDVFEDGRGLQREELRFREGWYNGKNETRHDSALSDPDKRLRRRYRDFDAAEYF